MKFRFVCLISTIAISGAAMAAPNKSSFIQPSFLNGVVITKLSEASFDVQVLGGATVTDASGTYGIQDLFGVYRIADNDHYSSTGVTQNGTWDFEANFSGPGGVAGWATKPPQSGQQPGDPKLTFNYSTVTGAGDKYGVHVRLSNGYTKYYEVPPTAVPEPTTLAVVGGAFAFLARRRRK